MHVLATKKESITSNAAAEIARIKAETASSHKLMMEKVKSEMIISHTAELEKALNDLKVALEDCHATELSAAIEGVHNKCASVVKQVEKR